MPLDPLMPILVVDDFPLVAAMMPRCCVTRVSQRRTAHSGHQATEKLGSARLQPHHLGPQNAEMSGLDLFTAIAQSELVEKPRFIIVTASRNWRTRISPEPAWTPCSKSR
jgi:DNA-binding response OmpR family regulator